MSGRTKATDGASGGDKEPAPRQPDVGAGRLLTVEEVAEYLSVPVNTLYQWRHKGTGPTAFRVGRYLRYDLADVRDWLHENTGAGRGVG